MEFALVAPLLILLVFGTIEFGWFFFTQANVANAAREGAREMAISGNLSTAKTTATNAAQPTSVKLSDVSIMPAVCSPGNTVTVTINVTYPALTGMFGKTFT
ncbi:MAG: TadE/TadG family type IV pilus assembly protein, partial [Arachnia sp.]